MRHLCSCILFWSICSWNWPEGEARMFLHFFVPENEWGGEAPLFLHVVLNFLSLNIGQEVRRSCFCITLSLRTNEVMRHLCSCILFWSICPWYWPEGEALMFLHFFIPENESGSQAPLFLHSVLEHLSLKLARRWMRPMRPLLQHVFQWHGLHLFFYLYAAHGQHSAVRGRKKQCFCSFLQDQATVAMNFLCTYTHSCTLIYTYAHTYTLILARKHTYTQLYSLTHTHTLTHVHSYIHMHTHTFSRLRTHIHTLTHTHTRTHTHSHTLTRTQYWSLPADATMRDLILAVRADEACHSHVNHTLKELRPDEPNPFVMGKSQAPWSSQSCFSVTVRAAA